MFKPRRDAKPVEMFPGEQAETATLPDVDVPGIGRKNNSLIEFNGVPFVHLDKCLNSAKYQFCPQIIWKGNRNISK